MRLDSIPSCNGFHTMLCIDSIHAFGVIWRGTVEIFTKLWYNKIKRTEDNLYDAKRTMRSIA